MSCKLSNVVSQTFVFVSFKGEHVSLLSGFWLLVGTREIAAKFDIGISNIIYTSYSTIIPCKHFFSSKAVDTLLLSLMIK